MRADHPLGRARRLVEVDLLEHEEARQDERLDRRAAPWRRRWRAPARVRVVAARREAQAAEEPVEIVDAVAHAGRVGVAEEVVAAVDVERAAHRLGQVGQRVLAADERRDARRHRRVDSREDLVHAGRRVEDDALGPRLVVRRPGDGVLEEVRERAVADVVEERGGERVARAVGRDAAARTGARRGSRGAARGGASSRTPRRPRGRSACAPRRGTRATSRRAGGRAAGAAPPACR